MSNLEALQVRFKNSVKSGDTGPVQEIDGFGEIRG